MKRDRGGSESLWIVPRHFVSHRFRSFFEEGANSRSPSVGSREGIESRDRNGTSCRVPPGNVRAWVRREDGTGWLFRSLRPSVPASVVGFVAQAALCRGVCPSAYGAEVTCREWPACLTILTRCNQGHGTDVVSTTSLDGNWVAYAKLGAPLAQGLVERE
jgi:hypothetical protein